MTFFVYNLTIQLERDMFILVCNPSLSYRHATHLVFISYCSFVNQFTSWCRVLNDYFRTWLNRDHRKQYLRTSESSQDIMHHGCATGVYFNTEMRYAFVVLQACFMSLHWSGLFWSINPCKYSNISEAMCALSAIEYLLKCVLWPVEIQTFSNSISVLFGVVGSDGLMKFIYFERSRPIAGRVIVILNQLNDSLASHLQSFVV